MTVHFDEAKGRHIIKFELHHNGKRIRKTKMMAAGIDYDTAVQIERRMLDAYDEPYADLRRILRELTGDDDHGTIYVCISGDANVKIGLTRRTVYERLKSFNVSAVEPWRLVGDVRVRQVEKTEAAIHGYLHEKRIHANREMFAMTEGEARSLLDAVEGAIGCADPCISAINAIGRRSQPAGQ